MNVRPAVLLALAFILANCTSENPSPPENAAADSLREALTFYASFDSGADADVALGDARIYTAPTWDDRYAGEPGLPDASIARLAPEDGISGGALLLSTDEEPVVYFKAQDNMHYQNEDWSGTVSFWLSLDPDQDLKPGFCDPIQVTASAWNDACFFVDFTEESPRVFRAAAFADLGAWEMPRPEIEVSQPPFADSQWTHVVMTFSRFNTDTDDGVLKLYMNGRQAGVLTDRMQTFTWEPETALIRIGYRYIGRFDELAFFNRALSQHEIDALYNMTSSLHPPVEG